MRRKDKEIIDPLFLEKIINTASVCRLGLVENNIPYIVPLSFGYTERCLYFHSAPEGKKVDIIKVNPKACFEIDFGIEEIPSDSPCSWSMRYLSVIGFGDIRPIADVEEKKRALDIIVKHYARLNNNNLMLKSLAELAVFKLEIESMTGKKSGYNQ